MHKRKQTIVKGLIYNFIDNERMIKNPQKLYDENFACGASITLSDEIQRK